MRLERLQFTSKLELQVLTDKLRKQVLSPLRYPLSQHIIAACPAFFIHVSMSYGLLAD